jgi:hypothetical protein
MLRNVKIFKYLKSFKSFLDEAFGFIDIFGAKPLIFRQKVNGTTCAASRRNVKGF